MRYILFIMVIVVSFITGCAGGGSGGVTPTNTPPDNINDKVSRVEITPLPQKYLRYYGISIINPNTENANIYFDISDLPKDISISNTVPAGESNLKPCKKNMALAYKASCILWLHANSGDTLGIESGILQIQAQINQSNFVKKFILTNETDLYIGGDFLNITTSNQKIAANSIAKFNGSNWGILKDSSGKAGVTDDDKLNPGQVYSFALSDSDLYIGGAFKYAGDILSNNIVKWNGIDWESLNNGVSLNDPGVKALAVGKNGELYVGGNFAKAGDISAHNIAMWNESMQTWSNLGSGLTDSVLEDYFMVQSLAIDKNGLLYAGGTFRKADDKNIANIAVWDGSSWQSLGDGLRGSSSGILAEGVYSLVFDSHGQLYAGGAFQHSGKIKVDNIAMWDGANWSSLGVNIMNNLFSPPVPIYTLSFDSTDKLYLGGTFFSTDITAGEYINQIASYYNSSLHSLGQTNPTTTGLRAYEQNGISGVNAQVVGLATDKSNNVYAVGNFGFVGAYSVNSLGKWNGGSWSPVGQITIDQGNNIFLYSITIAPQISGTVISQ